MSKKLRKIPLLEDTNTNHKLTDLLYILKNDGSLDSTRIMKIRNMLSVVNGYVTINDVQHVLYLLGSDYEFVDKITNKLREYAISNK